MNHGKIYLEVEYCPQCKTHSAKRGLAGKLSSNILNTWRCGCGLIMTENILTSK